MITNDLTAESRQIFKLHLCFNNKTNNISDIHKQEMTWQYLAESHFTPCSSLPALNSEFLHSKIIHPHCLCVELKTSYYQNLVAVVV